MDRRLRLLLASALGAAVTLGAIAAHAEPAAADKQRAAAAFDDAVTKFNRAEFAEAARGFFEADRLAPSTIAITNAIAAARRANDHLLVARAAERAIARGDALVEARAALAEAATRLARLELSCDVTPCAISVDGAPENGGAAWVLPGTRRVEAKGAGGTTEERVVCMAGATYKIALHPTAPTPQPKEPIKPAQTGLPRAVFFAGLGVTAVLAGVTTWSGVDALAAKRALPQDAAEQAQIDDVLSRAHRTNFLLLGTALAGAGTAVLGVFTELAHRRSEGGRRRRHHGRRRPAAGRPRGNPRRPPAMSGDALPPRVGPYEILFELAQGGMGTVHLARAVGAPVGASGFERFVAIKRLHHHLSAQPDSVQRFLDEAKVAARIHHANVVGVHQVGSDEAGHFLVQDYVEGDTLQGLVDLAALKRRKLPPPIVLRIALDALAGLHAVHEATDADGRPLGILHRDVSTQNLLVGRDGVTRLADFGIAKHALRSVVTDGQYLQGRVLYMPPEYLARRPIDRRFDVYGMGITLWTALVGEPPWADASDAQIVHLAVTEGIPALSASGLAIAPAIEAIVARACRRDPDERYASAHEMLAAIEELGRHTGWIASHVEVAELVDQLAGKDLAARRAALSRARGAIASVSEATPPGTMIARPRSDRPRRARAITSTALAAALVTTATALMWAWRRPPATMTPAAASTPAASTSATASAAVTANAAVTASASATASSAPPTESPAATTSATAARPLAPSTGPRRPPPPRASATAASGPPAPPAGISTANPYR
ncbi:MAG: serine/threonine-protein kinase [Minicystis sp.]